MLTIWHSCTQTDDDDDFFMESYRLSRGCVVSVQGSTTPQPIEPMDLPKSVSPMVRNEMPSRPLPKSFIESMRMPSIVETLSKMKPRPYHSVTLGNACKLLWLSLWLTSCYGNQIACYCCYSNQVNRTHSWKLGNNKKKLYTVVVGCCFSL